MLATDLSDLTVAQIMREWPATITVFMAFHMHCVGCPIGVFHTMNDAAREHGIPLDELAAKIEQAIARAEATAGRAARHRR